MDIYDVFCKKIGYRKLSKREKILSSLLILLLIEFLFYNFLLKNEVQSTSEASLKDNMPVIEEKFTYKGFHDFSQDKLEKIAKERNISKDNFSKESQSDIESLIIKGSVNSNNLNKIENLINYYGYSSIDLTRSDEENFNYRLKAEKPSKAIYYSDLKKAYFEENKQIEKKKSEDKEKQEASDEKNSEKITNTKKNIQLKNKKQSNIKNKAKNQKQIKGHEETIKNLDNNSISAKPLNLRDSIKSESIFEQDKTKSSEEGLKFIESDNIKLDYYQEDGITSVFASKKDLNDKVKLGVDRHCNGLSFSIYLPKKSFREMGTINIAGENLPFSGEILENQWTRINLAQDDISYIYFIAEENEDLLLFLKEVDYYEEEQGLYPN